MSLQVVFGPLEIPQFLGFQASLLTLFQAFADKFEYSVLDQIDDLGLPEEAVQAYRLYGTIIFIIYTIVSTILLGNLLIAIITNRYRPESTRQQSILNFAQTVDAHQWLVSQRERGSVRDWKRGERDV